MKQEINKLGIEEEEEKEIYKTKEANMSTLTLGLAGWAAVVTIGLVVILALVFRRMRRNAQMTQHQPFSDAESGVSGNGMSSASSDISSVVDLDFSTSGTGDKHNQDGGGFENDAYDEDVNAYLAGPSVHVALPAAAKGLDTEVTGDTISAIAHLPQDEDDLDVQAHKPAPNEDRSNFRHATYRGPLHLPTAGSSAL